uniref:NADH-ubiquinone oxidoreductase chain 2 n=1 Tax=Phascolosoma scolops TaxID=210802 RepID=A0A8E8FTP5_9ANNE|nr:NADH dehydrogenase subunit 2 [Phascolosoma scolops]
MFLFFPYSYLFSFFLFSSALMALSASNWLAAWFAMELNLLSFIPIMISSNYLQELEGATKYFFSQSTGSVLILWGAFSAINISHYLILMGLFLKLGIAPFHFWFPSVMSSTSWETCMILASWQKIPTLGLLFFFSKTYLMFFLMIGSVSAITGGILGLNQTQLRALLAYSAVNHTGWIIAIMSISMTASWLYFIVYIIISLTLMNMFKTLNSNFFWSFSLMNLISMALLLSLGGLPPLSGFAVKLGAISLMANLSTPTTLCLIMGALLGLYYYLCLSFSFLLRNFSFQLPTSPALSKKSCMFIIVSLLFFTIFSNTFVLL